MPYQIIKSGDKYQLKNKNTGKVLKKKFVSRDTAKKTSENYMKYEKRKPKQTKSKIGVKKSKY